MEKIDVKQLNDNVFETIDKEWLLVCSGDKDNFNMMTASWGCLGWLWNKPVAVVFIRPERHTHELIEKNEYMTLSFLGHSEEVRKIYNFCGSKSGRDFDKAKETGLVPVETENGSIGFEQARLTLECRKLYKDTMTAEKFWIRVSCSGMEPRADSTMSMWWRLPMPTRSNSLGEQ